MLYLSHGSVTATRAGSMKKMTGTTNHGTVITVKIKKTVMNVPYEIVSVVGKGKPYEYAYAKTEAEAQAVAKTMLKNQIDQFNNLHKGA
jgi:hypothetical protein